MTFRSVPVAVNRSSNGHFPLESIVHIDPDHFKGVMSEWKPYVQKAKNDHSIQAGTLCHRESAYIQEIAQEAALEANQNIWVDGSLKDGKWFTKVFQDIRARFPAYRIGIFYVYASEAIIRQRIKVRQEQTGRSVPEQQLMASLDAPDRSLGMLMPHVDFVARINNNDSVRNPLVPSAHLHIRPSAPSILVPETHRQRILTLCTPYACQPAHTAGRSPLTPLTPLTHHSLHRHRSPHTFVLGCSLARRMPPDYPDLQVPKLDAFENVDLTGSWASIGRRFARTQPAKSDFPNELAPLYLAPVHSFPFDAFGMSPTVIAQLQDYSPDHDCAISVTVKVPHSNFDIKYRLFDIKYRLFCTISPISHAFFYHIPPYTRRAMYSTQRPCLFDADWRFCDPML